MKKSHSKLTYWLIFTVVFLITAVLVFSGFVLKNKSIVYNNDGYYQHYNALVYYGEYLRGIVLTLVREHRLVIPMLDMSLGFGADVLTTLNYYVMGDPLCLLTVFVPASRMEYFFFFLVIIRMYLAGVSFMLMTFGIRKTFEGETEISIRNTRFGVMAGALIYAFSGFMLIPGSKHIMFSMAAVYLPLVILGIEKILAENDNNSSFLFVIVTALAAVTNFYFFYIIVEFGILYFVFRYCFYYRKKGLKLFDAIVRFIQPGLKAFLLASAIFLPVIMAMLSSKRMGVRHYLPLLYDFKYYLVNFSGFMTGEYLQEGTFYTYYGFTAMGILGMFVLFALNRKSKLSLKIAAVLLLVFSLVPFFGYALSGFSYVNNRWSFAFSLLAAYIFSRIISDTAVWSDERLAEGFGINVPNLSDFKGLFLAVFIYGFLIFSSETMRSEASLSGLALLGLGVILFTFVKSGIADSGLFEKTIIILTVLGIVSNAVFVYSDLDGRMNRGVPYQNMSNNPTAVLDGIEDINKVRYDSMDMNDTLNQSWQKDYLPVNYYYSVLNGNVSEFLTKNEISNTTEYRFNNMDGRSILNALTGVKYAIVRQGEEDRLPFGYDTFVKEGVVGDTFSVYKSDLALPLGYVYDKKIDTEEFNTLDGVRAQQAMLYGAAVEGDTAAEYETATVSYNESILSATTKNSDGVIRRLQEGKDAEEYFVTEKNAFVTFSIEPQPDSELYLQIKNFNYADLNPYAKAEGFSSVYERLQNEKNKRNFVPEDKGYFSIRTDGRKQEFSVNNDRQPAYSGKHDYIYNLGYFKDGISEFELVFEGLGCYSFDDLRVISLPVGGTDTRGVSETINELKSNSFENTELTANRISGSIPGGKAGVFCLSIPYSEGFKAYVDGVRTKIFRVNTMYMGIEVDDKPHDIVFEYETPYLKAGVLMTLIGFIWLLSGKLLKIKRK